MKRWHLYDLIRLALRAGFRPEDYILAATCSGAFSGLPASHGSLRALGLNPLHDDEGAILRRDAAYLVAWAERAGVETWTPGAMLIAALVPARLPWRDDPAAVLVSRERWPEGYTRLREMDREGAGVITVADADAYARRPTIEGRALRDELHAARLHKLGGVEVARFQAERGLEVTGRFDAATDRALVS